MIPSEISPTMFRVRLPYVEMNSLALSQRLHKSTRSNRRTNQIRLSSAEAKNSEHFQQPGVPKGARVAEADYGMQRLIDELAGAAFWA